MPKKTVKLLEESCQKQGTTMIVMTCQGLFASVQVRHCIIHEGMMAALLDRGCLQNTKHVIEYLIMQLSGPEMCIIESKPDSIPADLRIVNPWPELQDLADSIDLNTCDDITHKHTPWGAHFCSTCCSRDCFRLNLILATFCPHPLILPTTLPPQPCLHRAPGQAGTLCDCDT